MRVFDFTLYELFPMGFPLLALFATSIVCWARKERAIAVGLFSAGTIFFVAWIFILFVVHPPLHS